MEFARSSPRSVSIPSRQKYIFGNWETDNGWALDEALIPALGARFVGGFVADREWLDANADLGTVRPKKLVEPIVGCRVATQKMKMEVTTKKLKKPAGIDIVLKSFFKQLPSARVFRDDPMNMKQGFMICQDEDKASKRAKHLDEEVKVQAIGLIAFSEKVSCFV